MADLRLYAFRPEGHGPQSFYVMASSEDHARAMVDEYVQDMRENQNIYGADEWPGNYTMEVAGIGEVMSNDND